MRPETTCDNCEKIKGQRDRAIRQLREMYFKNNVLRMDEDAFDEIIEKYQEALDRIIHG